LKVAVSWIFALFLTAYGFVRAVLWMRGQIRYQMVKDDMPAVGVPRPVPEHLPPTLAAYFAATDALRVHVANDLRQISIVMVTDPDAPIGHIRDGRFRWAILDAWMRVREWRRTVESPTEHTLERVLLLEQYADHGVGAAPVDRCVERIRSVWWQAVRARQLDPFEIDDVRMVRGCLARLVAELEAQQDRLSQADAHPYRGSTLSSAQATVQLSG
jgi:hypothetical protein